MFVYRLEVHVVGGPHEGSTYLRRTMGFRSISMRQGAELPTSSRDRRPQHPSSIAYLIRSDGPNLLGSYEVEEDTDFFAKSIWQDILVPLSAWSPANTG